MQNFWKINPFGKLRIKKILLLLIILLGAFLRFYGLNWDQGFHLHPDERFLTMVGNDMKIPPDFLTYMDPEKSTLNPINIGHSFFVYGVFPVTVNKLFAILLNQNTYDGFTLLGRFLSGLSDLFVIFFLFKIAQIFEKRYGFSPSIKYYAVFFYAVAVLPIQLSHFFAVDTFLNCFVFGSFYFVLKFSLSENVRHAILSSIFLGLAFASKISAVFFLPLVLFFITKALIAKTNRLRHILIFVLYIVTFYITMRLANPYLFQTSNLLDLSINQTFLGSINMLRSFEGKDIWYPPAVQWISKPPVLFALINLAIFSVGMPYFIFVIAGLVVSIKKRMFDVLIIFVWMLLFFIFQSTQFAKPMRYFIFIYPFLAVFAAMGFSAFTKQKSLFFKVLAFSIIIVWPLAFFSIYTKEHSRTTASKWIYENIENGSIILAEHWDDALPLPLSNPGGKVFRIEQLLVFDQDTQEKWIRMNALLKQADYYILSSNRGWGSISTVPEKYPRMSKFYNDLFAEKLSYKKVKEFTSYPSLGIGNWQLEMPDDWSDESFTVYDHPKVTIFKKELN